MTGAPLSPSTGGYLIVSAIAFYGLWWIISRARARVSDDPVARDYQREEWRPISRKDNANG